MPIADPTHAHARKRADARRHAPSRRSVLPLRASLLAIASLGALGPFAACVPTPFTFEETGTGGGAGSSTTAGGEGGSPTTSSASGGGGDMSSSSSSTGTGVVNPCGSGAACVEAVPPDWEALAIVIVSDDGGPKPQCPLGETPDKLFGGPPMEAHSCSGCSCNLAAVSCSAPQIMCWSGDSSCGNDGGAFYNAWTAPSTSCINDQGSSIDDNLPGSCKLTADAAPSPSGNCPPAGGKPIKPGWTLDVHVCEPAPPSGGMACGSNGMCAPLNAGEQLCIRKAGVQNCPTGWPTLVKGYTGANDERVCSACTCGPATCTGGAYTIYDGINCDATTGNVLVNSTTCIDVPNIIDASAMSLQPQLGTPVASTCSGGVPMGTFNPTGLVTFCCRPE